MAEQGNPSDTKDDQKTKAPSSPRAQVIPDELLNMVGASPPQFVSFEELMKAAEGMKNMSLAHEIAVNNDFSLEQAQLPENSFEKKVRETVHQAFWDTFDEKLKMDPPDYGMAYKLVEDLKQILTDLLLPQHTRLKDQISEVLDMELIKQQMEQKAFDFEYYSNYIIDTMSRICAPARDEKIVEIRAIQGVTPKFRAIMETLELLKRDMANFTIKQVRPYIQQNSIEYEKKKFTEFFEKQKELGINALQYTEVWLKRNYDKMTKNAHSPQASSGSSSNPIPTPANVLTTAYLEIFDWPDPYNFPETLVIDEARFMAVRDRLHMLGLITSVQLITYSVVGPSIDGVEDLKIQLKEHVEILLADVAQRGIKASLESIGEQVVKDVNENLKSRDKSLLSEEVKQSLKGQILSLGARDNKVRSIMYNRLMEFVTEGMSGKSVNNLRVPKGCTAIHIELAQLMGNFLRLTSHNRSVFGSHYSEIIEDIINKKVSDSDGRAKVMNG